MAGSILRGAPARTTGTEVHRLFAGIEWIDGMMTPADESETSRMVRHFLESEEARQIFARPAGPVLLWRERAFVVELEGRLVSGIFDRVHVHLDDASQPVSAQIFDFKTGEDRGQYDDQMRSYRAAACALLGLEEDDVTTCVVTLAAV